jgi:hypothetical protein
MKFILQPWQLMLIILASWVNRQQQEVIEYDRISGALSNLGYHICDSTIGNILKAHGIEPAPTRKRTGSWETFLKAHWDVMASIDFTTVEVWTKGGLGFQWPKCSFEFFDHKRTTLIDSQRALP